jgi:hypothetical protein
MKEIEAIRNKFNNKSKQDRKETLLDTSYTTISQQSIASDDKDSKLLLPPSKMNKHFNDDYDDDSDVEMIVENKKRILSDREASGDHYGISKINSYNFTRDSSIASSILNKSPKKPPMNGAGDTPPSKEFTKSPKTRLGSMGKLYDIQEVFRVAGE